MSDGQEVDTKQTDEDFLVQTSQSLHVIHKEIMSVFKDHSLKRQHMPTPAAKSDECQGILHKARTAEMKTSLTSTSF